MQHENAIAFLDSLNPLNSIAVCFNKLNYSTKVLKIAYILNRFTLETIANFRPRPLQQMTFTVETKWPNNDLVGK